jgi:hypothetical protein
MSKRSGAWSLANVVALGTVACSLVVDTRPLEEGCPPQQKECFGLCFGLDSPEVGCGQPGCVACPSKHAIAGCLEGKCVILACASGYLRCTDSDPECSTPQWTPNDCQACSDVCRPDPVKHTSAECVPEFGCKTDCETGFGNCDGQSENGCEADLNSSPGNCGACGNSCEPGEKCGGGLCVPA